MDMTFNPPHPPKTTQNGIVLIYAILRLFVDDMLVRVHIVSVILAFNLFVIFIFIYKIALFLKFDKISIFYLLFAFAFAYYFYGYFVSPTNDGFFASLSLIAIYYVIKLFEENKKSYYLVLILIAILAPLFRIQSLVVFIAALISSLLIMKQYKISLFMFLLVLIGFGSIAISSSLLISDFTILQNSSHSLITHDFNLAKLGYALFDTVHTAIPSIFLNFPATRLSSVIFTVGKVTFSLFVIGIVVLIFADSFRKKNFARFFISLFIIGTFSAMVFFNTIIDRYIYLTMPLIILLATSYIKKIYHCKIFLVLLIFNLSILGYRFYQTSYDFNTVIKNTQFLNENIEHYSLISQLERQTYFYLKKPSMTNYRLLKENSIIIIIGEDMFIQERLRELKGFIEILQWKELPLKWTGQGLEVNTIEVGVGYFNDK